MVVQSPRSVGAENREDIIRSFKKLKQKILIITTMRKFLFEISNALNAAEMQRLKKFDAAFFDQICFKGIYYVTGLLENVARFVFGPEIDVVLGEAADIVKEIQTHFNLRFDQQIKYLVGLEQRMASATSK